MCQGDGGVKKIQVFLGPKTESAANDYTRSLEWHLSDFEDIHQNMPYGNTIPLI